MPLPVRCVAFIGGVVAFLLQASKNPIDGGQEVRLFRLVLSDHIAHLVNRVIQVVNNIAVADEGIIERLIRVMYRVGETPLEELLL